MYTIRIHKLNEKNGIEILILCDIGLNTKCNIDGFMSISYKGNCIKRHYEKYDMVSEVYENN